MVWLQAETAATEHLHQCIVICQSVMTPFIIKLQGVVASVAIRHRSYRTPAPVHRHLPVCYDTSYDTFITNKKGVVVSAANSVGQTAKIKETAQCIEGIASVRQPYTFAKPPTKRAAAVCGCSAMTPSSTCSTGFWPLAFDHFTIQP
jgi:hypothetical protein